MKPNPGQLAALEPYMTRKVYSLLRSGPPHIVDLVYYLAMGDCKSWTMATWAPVVNGLKTCNMTIAEWLAQMIPT